MTAHDAAAVLLAAGSTCTGIGISVLRGGGMWCAGDTDVSGESLRIEVSMMRPYIPEGAAGQKGVCLEHMVNLRTARCRLSSRIAHRVGAAAIRHLEMDGDHRAADILRASWRQWFDVYALLTFDCWCKHVWNDDSPLRTEVRVQRHELTCAPPPGPSTGRGRTAYG